MKFYLDKWNTGTAVAGTDKITPESGTYPFTPAWVIPFMAGPTGTTDGFGGFDLKPSIGLVATVTNRACIFGQSDDATATSATDRGHSFAAALGSIVNTGTIDGIWDIVSFDADTITWEPDDAMPSSYRVFSLVGDDADVLNKEVVNWQDKNGTGTHTIPFSFPPDFILDISVGLDTDPQVAAGINTIIVSACKISTLDQWVYWGRDRDADTTPNSAGYFRGGEFLGVPADPPIGTPVKIGTVTGVSGNNVNLNYSTSSTLLSEHFTLGMRFAGGANQVKVATIDTLTNTTTDIDVTVPGLPVGGIVVSACKAENASGTPHADMRMSFGAWSFDGTTIRQGAQFVAQDDTSDPSITFRGTRHADCYLNGDADVLGAVMQVRAIENGIVHFRMVVAEGSATKVGVVVFYNPTSFPPVSPLARAYPALMHF